ncbi:MAG: acyl-CoA dehydrogenase family protein [Gemmatimonadota bacterium]
MVPSIRPVRAFLEPRHVELAERIGELVSQELAGRPEPADDAEARRQAREILSRLGAGGWYAPIAEQDFRACCLIREALAAASPLADAVFALQTLGGTPLLLAGNEALRDRWLPGLLEGTLMAAFAMTEPEAGSDVASLRMTARRDGNEYVLSGRKTLISNAGIADFYVTFATTDPDDGRRGITCFVVPADAPGLRFVKAQVLSAPHPLGEIELDGCRVAASDRLGAEGEGFGIGILTLERLRPTVGAAACGMAARALREAVRHASRREQFGRPLARFQIVQEKLARMATELAAARLLVYRAAWETDAGADRTATEASMAKAFATEAAQRIVDDAVQILGGRGVLKENPLDRLYRSVRALRIYEGTTEIQRLIIAKGLIEAAAADREDDEAAGGTEPARGGTVRPQSPDGTEAGERP